jgi:serine/threonine-protein phosphatase PP1 catalytic subunit
MCHVYGFERECLKRASKSVFDEFVHSFRHLPIVGILNSAVFCVHGGISPNLRSVHKLCHLAKPKSIPKDGLIADLLWSDPQANIDGFTTGARGIGHNFGYLAVAHFLARNRLQFLIRSHEYCNGFQWAFAQHPEYSHKCLTILDRKSVV